MGNSQQEYQNLAKKSHMDDLQLEILKLKDRVMGILRNLDFDQVRWLSRVCPGSMLRFLLQDKMLQFDQAVGSTSKSIMYISIIQVRIHFYWIRAHSTNLLARLPSWLWRASFKRGIWRHFSTRKNLFDKSIQLGGAMPHVCFIAAQYAMIDPIWCIMARVYWCLCTDSWSRIRYLRMLIPLQVTSNAHDALKIGIRDL